jgi:hypothetical protein
MFGKGQPRWLEALKLPSEKAKVKFREAMEGMTHNQRMATMVELGRRGLLADGSAERARDVIAGMRQAQFFERYLALNSCHGSRDTEHVLEAIRDRSETLRAIAARMIVIYGSDAEIFKAFGLINKSTLKSFVKQLNKRKRFAVIDQILKTLESTEPIQFAAMLPYGSEEFVQAHWPTVESDCTELEWTRLARNKQKYAQERMLNLVDSTPDYDPQVRHQAVSVLNVFAKVHASGTIELVNALLRICSITQLQLANLVAAYPIEMARLAVEQEDRISVDFSRAFPKIKDENLLAALIRKYPPHWGIAQVLKKLPVVARSRVYDELASMWRSEGDGVIDDAILEVLPGDIRVREARAHLAMESLSSHPQLQMQYAAFLPWQEARDVLKPFIRDPDPLLRALGWRCLIAALRYNREHLGLVLEEIRQKKNEQDPVKYSIFDSLSQLPPAVFKIEYLTNLGGAVQDVLDSRDLSTSTASCVETLLLKLVPFHPQWSSTTLAIFWRQRGASASSSAVWQVNEREALQIEEQIIPVLKQWNRKEYDHFVLTAAASFGPRLKVTKQITTLLRSIVVESRDQYSSERGLSLLAQYAFDTLKDVVPSMLERDPSWGTKQKVVDYLVRYRQDLLTPFLGGKAHRGRFNTGKNRVVPQLNYSAIFLSDAQQKLYADALNSMASDDDNKRYENFFVIANLSRLHDVPIKYLTRFLKQPAGSQVAILALSRLDDGRGMPLLVGALDNPETAAIATYALRTALLKMSADDAIEIIQRAPRTQVTIFKEIVRLLGDIKSDEAFAELCKIAGEEIHRDVRVALLRAYWNHLDRKEAWDALREAVNNPEEAIAYTAIRTPANRLSKEGQRSIVSLLLGGLRHQSARVRLKTLERLYGMPVPDADMALLDAIIELLGSDIPEECRAAAGALIRLYPHKAVTALPKAAEAIMGKRLNIRTLVEVVEYALQTQRTRFIPGVYATFVMLEKDPLTLMLRARLAVNSMPWTELALWLTELDGKKLLHADLLQEIGAQLLNSTRPDFEELVEFEAELRNAESDVLKRVSLYALQAQSGERHGWNEERLARLESYRADSSSYIAEVAQFILPEEEDLLRSLSKI